MGQESPMSKFDRDFIDFDEQSQSQNQESFKKQ